MREHTLAEGALFFLGDGKDAAEAISSALDEARQKAESMGFQLGRVLVSKKTLNEKIVIDGVTVYPAHNLPALHMIAFFDEDRGGG